MKFKTIKERLPGEQQSNWDYISLGHQELFDAAIIETQNYYKSIGEDPDDVGFKEIAQYVNSKPYPYTPKKPEGTE